MTKISFEEIEEIITTWGWVNFGEKDFECPGLGEEELEFYVKNDRLPLGCDECYKALIFWEGSYSKENVMNFLNLIRSLETDHVGKFNKSVVVFYFRSKTETQDFLNNLEKKLQQFNVKGKTQWRRACKKYQTLKPELWRNAKEFIPDT